ncbi:C40 family peptidase [Paenibacillus sp. LHD-117]|uniref:C40 family peptidase n=1 Tax=Paenibacillus sp. LHD-117 TaxID=3071412 RepID=UPI0027DEF8E0|nr:C40 family peptidase [Paenibacillus sp. LHD-117]MDQ6421787.1 C40 family peptidase [Paenibacillus sp. LHD-117]
MRNGNLLKHIVKIGTCGAIVWSAITFGASADTAHAATPTSLSLISKSKNYIGTPYLYGAAAGSTAAFDCSSFTQYMFKSVGVWLPRTSTAQAWMGKKVDKGSLSMGDLIFYSTNGGKSISHVAIYAGSNKIIHSSSSKGVSVTDMNSSYWKTKYVTARRVL